MSIRNYIKKNRRQSSIAYSTICSGATSLNTPQLAAGSFNIQKNIRYDIQHVNSENYNAMKCHYLLTQIADILLQLYEKGSPGLREAKRTIKNISSDLLKSFGKKLSSEDILFIETHGYVKAVV